MENVICAFTYADKDADVRAFFHVPQAYDSDGEPIGDISVSSCSIRHAVAPIYNHFSIAELTSIGWMSDSQTTFGAFIQSDRTIFIQTEPLGKYCTVAFVLL